MNYEDFNRSLEQHIDSEFNAAPVNYENAPAPITPYNEWVAVSTVFGGAEPTTMGATHETHETGIVFFRIFVPDGQGSKRAREIADSIVSIMSNQFIGETYFYPAHLSGTSQSDGLFQMNVQAPFYRRVINTA